MQQRGRILRDTRTGPGLIIVNGRQYPFTLEGVWRSNEAPAVNMTVDALFDDTGELTALVAVPDTQLAREKADDAVAVLKARGGQLAARVGTGTLVGTGLLAMAWFALNTVSVQLTPGMKMGMSLWKLLGVLNASGDAMAALSGNGGSSGMYGVLAIVALAGPVASYFVRDAHAQLANCLPLLFLLGIALAFYLSISNSLSQAQGAAMAFGGSGAADVVGAMTRQVMRAISIGAGGYLSCLVSLYFATTGVLKFFAKRT
ncbi:hypothetical protein [Ralstonia insidiosa]|uniref:Uncharacterized protein n=1 Tax=Ralstonia insidiosa TaxID=190721 RepID=A0A848P058_9RALS|nr:hypothetical protein [Ralstonia insidiosa]NMV38563.1 hypothetical protein [Ralstonia insidiosa]